MEIPQLVIVKVKQFVDRIVGGSQRTPKFHDTVVTRGARHCEPAKTQNYKEVYVRECLLNSRILRNWMSAVRQSSALTMKMSAIYSENHKALWGVFVGILLDCRAALV